jgi:regulator of protease activity HflC (stomatin/prohibitin superfamily)
VRQKALAGLREKIGNLTEINDVVIQNIDLSTKVEEAIEDKMVKQQHAEAKTFEQKIADADAKIAMTKADGEAYSIKAVSEALKQSPNMVALEAVKKWSGFGLTTLVIGGGAATPVIPLTSNITTNFVGSTNEVTH